VLVYQGQKAPPDHPDSGWFYDMWRFIPDSGWEQLDSSCDFETCAEGVPDSIAGLAFDTGSNRLVTANGETVASWDPQSSVWEERQAPGPTGILGAAATYDAQSDRIILFGGLDVAGRSVSDQTWTYDLDGNAWTEMAPAGQPGAGNFHVMAYDGESDRIILFGGADLADRALGDTWAYDFETDIWTRMSPPTSPPARYYTAMAYDGAGDRMILFGGTDNSESATFDDTWSYDYNSDTWTQIDAVGPTVRGWHGMAYDAESKSVVAFGGGLDRVDVTDETWIFDPTTDTWRLHAPLTLEDSGCRYGGPTQLLPGNLSIDFINDSDGPAAAQMFALDMDAAYADLVAHVEEELRRLEKGLSMMGHPAFTTDVAEVSVEAGESGELAAELQPGRYALVCADLDPEARGLHPYGPITVLE
jgi:hypothetical protein